jgi:hypothetical protein
VGKRRREGRGRKIERRKRERKELIRSEWNLTRTQNFRFENSLAISGEK